MSFSVTAHHSLYTTALTLGLGLLAALTVPAPARSDTPPSSSTPLQPSHPPSSLLSVPAPLAPKPSVTEFFGPTDVTSVELSPNGTRLLITSKTEDDIGSIVVYEQPTKKTWALRGRDNLDIYQAFWHGNDRIVFSVSLDNLYSYGLFVAPATQLRKHTPLWTNDVVDIIGHPAARPDNLITWTRHSAEAKGRSGLLREVNLAWALPKPSTHIHGITPREKLNVPEPLTIVQPTETVLGYLGAPDGDLDLVAVAKNNKPLFRYWDRASRTWKPLPGDTDIFTPHGRDFDDNYLWVVMEHLLRGSQLRRLDLRTGEIGEMVYQDARYDLNEAELVFSRLTRDLIGIRYQRQRDQTTWLSPKFEAIQRAVDGALPAEFDNTLSNWSDDETRFIVESRSPQTPDTFWLFDVKTRSLEGLGNSLPALQGKAVAQTSVLSFKSRDGLDIDGYLTVPKGASPANPVPLIMLAHGGPQARDGWQFDPEVQFLASLGYAVFQPNYRASSGYLWPKTKSYLGAYSGMRNDVIDATKTLLKTGLFDAKRVAVMGSSFGGYLALACSVEEPELYRCAVSVCGVFDWAEQVRSKRNTRVARPGEYEIMIGLLGDPAKVKADYEAVSPLQNLDKLRAPLLIAHGNEDSIVSVKQSKKLAKELKRRKLPYETFYRPLAGHGFYAAKDRVAFYQTLEKFLAQNLVAAPAGNP